MVESDEKVHAAATESLVFENGAICTRVDLRIYRLSAVQKTGYKMADRFTLILGPIEENELPLKFMFASGTLAGDATQSVRLFFQELLDQELREQIGTETAPLRALLLAHAFAKTDLIRRE